MLNAKIRALMLRYLEGMNELMLKYLVGMNESISVKIFRRYK